MPIDAFFQEIDSAWPDQPAGKIQLRLLGSTALMLQTRVSPLCGHLPLGSDRRPGRRLERILRPAPREEQVSDNPGDQRGEHHPP